MDWVTLTFQTYDLKHANYAKAMTGRHVFGTKTCLPVLAIALFVCFKCKGDPVHKKMYQAQLHVVSITHVKFHENR